MKITLAIPKGKKISQKLKQEIAASRNIKDKKDRDGISKGLSHIREQIIDGKVFLYDTDSEELIIVDYPLDEFIYFCGKEFVIPKQNIKLNNRYLIVVMDANHLTIGWSLGGRKPFILLEEDSNVPRKQDAGGQSELRYEKNRALALNQWFKHCADKMREYAKGGCS